MPKKVLNPIEDCTPEATSTNPTRFMDDIPMTEQLTETPELTLGSEYALRDLPADVLDHLQKYIQATRENPVILHVEDGQMVARVAISVADNGNGLNVEFGPEQCKLYDADGEPVIRPVNFFEPAFGEGAKTVLQLVSSMHRATWRMLTPIEAKQVYGRSLSVTELLDVHVNVRADWGAGKWVFTKAGTKMNAKTGMNAPYWYPVRIAEGGGFVQDWEHPGDGAHAQGMHRMYWKMCMYGRGFRAYIPFDGGSSRNGRSDGSFEYFLKHVSSWEGSPDEAREVYDELVPQAQEKQRFVQAVRRDVRSMPGTAPEGDVPSEYFYSDGSPIIFGAGAVRVVFARNTLAPMVQTVIDGALTAHFKAAYAQAAGLGWTVKAG